MGLIQLQTNNGTELISGNAIVKISEGNGKITFHLTDGSKIDYSGLTIQQLSERFDEELFFTPISANKVIDLT